MKSLWIIHYRPFFRLLSFNVQSRFFVILSLDRFCRLIRDISLSLENIATITDIRLDLKSDTPEKKTDTDLKHCFTKCSRNSFKQKIAFIHPSLPVTFVHPFSSSPPRAVRVGATKPVWSQGSRTAVVGPRYPTISTEIFFYVYVT